MSEENAEDNEYATEYGIEFSLATLNDIEELKTFIKCHFYPDEPICRCMGLANGSSFVDKYIRHVLYEYLITDPIKRNIATISCSIIARNIANNDIVGCYIGAICDRHCIKKNLVPNFLGDLPSCFCVPHKVICTVNLQSMFADLHYRYADAFEELKDSGELIYFGSCLAVSSATRGKGLGEEMLKRASKIAKEAGCRYTVIMVTDVYSQKIFDDIGNAEVLHEAQYADYEYDKKWRPFLSDTREHKVVQVLAIDHEL